MTANRFASVVDVTSGRCMRRSSPPASTSSPTAKAGFDVFVEETCKPHYAQRMGSASPRPFEASLWNRIAPHFVKKAAERSLCAEDAPGTEA